MTQYDNTNRGVLFINDRKEEGSNKPDRTGSINVDGVEYFLDGWIKSGQKGQFLSLSIKRKDKQPQQESRPAQRPQQPPQQRQQPPQRGNESYGGGYQDDDSAQPF